MQGSCRSGAAWKRVKGWQWVWMGRDVAVRVGAEVQQCCREAAAQGRPVNGGGARGRGMAVSDGCGWALQWEQKLLSRCASGVQVSSRSVLACTQVEAQGAQDRTQWLVTDVREQPCPHSGAISELPPLFPCNLLLPLPSPAPCSARPPGRILVSCVLCLVSPVLHLVFPSALTSPPSRRHPLRILLYLFLKRTAQTSKNQQDMRMLEEAQQSISNEGMLGCQHA